PAHLQGVADVVEPALAGDGEPAAELLLLDREFAVDLLIRLARGRGARAACLLRPLGVEPLVELVDAESDALDLHRADAFLKGLLERAANGHGLADALHLRRQRLIGIGELLKGPARDLDHAVVDGRFETGAGPLLVLVAQALATHRARAGG